MTRVVHYCRVSTVDQHPEPSDGATAARKIADTLCDPMKQAMNEAWERVLRLGIAYGYCAAERGEPLPEAIERALRATDVRSSDVRTMSREDVCQTERK
jgi:hypothetical protein